MPLGTGQAEAPGGVPAAGTRTEKDAAAARQGGWFR